MKYLTHKKDLLFVKNNNNGVDKSMRDVIDGSGAVLPFRVSHSGSQFKASSNGDAILTMDIGTNLSHPVVSFKSKTSHTASQGFMDIKIGSNNGNNSDAWGNVIVGQSNLQAIVATSEFSGGRNYVFGWSNGNTLTTSTNNIIAGRANASGLLGAGNFNYSLVMGYENIANATVAASNTLDQSVILGVFNLSGLNMTATSQGMIAIGNYVMAAPFGGSMDGRGIANGGLSSIGIGFNALFDSTFEQYQVVIGDSAGRRAVMGRANILMGTLAGADMVGGTPGGAFVGWNQFGIGIGTHALQFAGPYRKVTFVGTEAGSTAVSGTNHAGFGTWALNRTAGDNNGGLGSFAGYHATLTLTGSNNTFIGYESGYSVAAISDTIVLGRNLKAALSNKVYIAGPTQTAILGGGKVGAIAIEFWNTAAISSLQWNHTAARTITLPDADGSVAILQTIAAKTTLVHAWPTDPTGLPSGAVWNNAGILTVVA